MTAPHTTPATVPGRLSNGGSATGSAPTVAGAIPFRSPPRPATKCCRNACGRPYSEHTGEERVCPRSTPLSRGNTFLRHRRYDRKRASFSLDEREIEAIDAVLTMLVRPPSYPLERSRLVNKHDAALRKLERKLAHAREQIEARKKPEAAE